MRSQSGIAPPAQTQPSSWVNARMQEISAAVREGASAYLKRQYTTIGIVGVVIFVSPGGCSAPMPPSASHRRGALGRGRLHRHERVGARQCARGAGGDQVAGRGLDLAFKAGAVTGLLVAGLGLLGVTLYFIFLTGSLGFGPTSRTVIDALVALSFGASLISIFARLGGGIFTKGADVGGDMVGKVEAGIPEDDPRNPATIADNVGDNVGDCAGMAADLFETYVVTAVATMVLAAIALPDAFKLAGMVLPLAIGGACVITSIIGTYFVKLGASNNIMGALYKGVIATGVLSLIALYPVLLRTPSAASTPLLGVEGGKHLHAVEPVLVRRRRPRDHRRSSSSSPNTTPAPTSAR
jgi:K(+)-stimulated pyrophosphate-energized sodium pump